MVDHLARAKEMRARAKNCELSAKQSKSAKFAACYRALVENYNILATVEEEFLAREIAAARGDVSRYWDSTLGQLPRST
jgi:hypothetical protein